MDQDSPVQVKRSWNFRKANWDGFTQELENLCSNLPEQNNLEELLSLFTRNIQIAAKHHIPRGKLKEFHSGKTKTSKNLFMKEIILVKSSRNLIKTLNNSSNSNQMNPQSNVLAIDDEHARTNIEAANMLAKQYEKTSKLMFSADDR
ncbi:hypothetical protein CDAR_112231 [Caerostris darwini]|uniref:Uncharacterized protein n=1 Tax=Caerostris darwini TaxID=1538125 RepID=A0AAV4TIJ6_9ARAC|nr:hypothetical protein CDAR_112231 [Caerostris darwini]